MRPSLVAKFITGMFVVGVMISCQQNRYTPDWESLTQHEDPEWFRDAKFGIYVHWGVYSVPAWGHEWYPRKMYIDKMTNRGNFYQHHMEHYGDPAEFGYKDFIPMFKAEKFDADEWAELFKNAGARFAGPVAEHHDGFTMWDSDLTEWDAVEKGPKRDIVGELATAIRKRDMKLITSLHHARKWWFYELSYTEDQRYDTEDPQYSGLYPPPHKVGAPPTVEYMEEWEAKTVELIDKYRPDMLWFDSGLDREKFWRESREAFQAYKKRVLAYYYNKEAEWDRKLAIAYKDHDLAPGAGILDFERGRNDTLSKEIWLTDTSIGRNSWSYVEGETYKSADEMIDVLVDIVSKNGQLLLNIGPRADGTIPMEAQETLLEMGRWLKINGEAIYGSRPWKISGEGPNQGGGGMFGERKNKVLYGAEDIRFTTQGDVLYAIALGWPESAALTISSLATNSDLLAGDIASITMLGHEGQLEWSRDDDGLHVQFASTPLSEIAVSLKIELTD